MVSLIVVAAPPQRLVAAHGFYLENNQGNYRREMNTAATPPQLWDIADLMLELLYQTYDPKIGDVAAVFPMRVPAFDAVDTNDQ